MNDKNTPVIERGLAKTGEFFNSPAFQRFYEKEKREDRYNHIKPGLTEAEINELMKQCNERFGCSPPQGWLIFLRIMNGFYRIYGCPSQDEGTRDFFGRNTYNLENEYFCDDEGNLIYLMIGREDDTYYGYNMKTGKYAELDSVAHDEYKIFHSFTDMFLNMMYRDGWADEMDTFFHDFLECHKEEDARFQKEQLALGDRCYKGEGVERDYAQAAYHYREAAETEEGAADAQYKLGLCYANGHGIEQNVWEAAYWYWKAADNGHAVAQYCLGLCYDSGCGVEEDIAKAAEWYGKAAEQGNEYAQERLAEIDNGNERIQGLHKE